MADSIPVTPGSGRNVGVDAGQTMPDGSTADVQFAERFRSIAYTSWLAPTVTTASAYATGNVVGDIITFAGAARRSGGGGSIRNIQAVHDGDLAASYDLTLFNDTPSAVTDRTQWSPSAADLQKVVARLGGLTVDKVAGGLGGRSLWSMLTDYGFVVDLPYLCAATSLYGLFTIPASLTPPTYTSSSELKVRLLLERD
jgi:hypothetical protein